jgi:hypothetical protein
MSNRISLSTCNSAMSAKGDTGFSPSDHVETCGVSSSPSSLVWTDQQTVTMMIVYFPPHAVKPSEITPSKRDPLTRWSGRTCINSNP